MEEIIDLCDDSFDKDDDYVSVVVDNGNDIDNDYSNQFYSDRNTTLEGDYINTEVSSTTGPVDLPVRVSIPERKAETNVKSKPKPTLKAQLSTISSKAATSSSSSSSLIAATSSSCQYKSYYPKNANAFRRKGGTNAAVTAVTSIAAVKVPQTNNAYREVGLVVEDSVINRQHIKKLLECFTVQASNMSLLLLTPDGIGTNKNKKERIQNELILRELEQNQLRAHTDHSLFRLYADKRLTIPGLCLWTHRRIELGGNCGLGGTNSTVYPFSVILYSSERFANLVFSSLLDRYTVTSGISCSSSSIGTGSRIASIFSEEFSLLHDEVVCLRKRLQDILGEQSGRCRLTLVLTALDIHLVAKVKEVHDKGESRSVFEVVEDAVVYLAQEHGVSVVMARTGEEALDYLHTVSRTLAESVYRKKAHELDCVSRRKMQQQTNDAGEGQFGNDESSSNLPGGKAKAELRHIWTAAIEMVPGISRTRALNFASLYSCPKSARTAAHSFIESSTQSNLSTQPPPLTSDTDDAPLSMFQLMMAQARAPPVQENARMRVAKRKEVDPMHGFQLDFNAKRSALSQSNSQATDFSDFIGDGSNMSVHSSNSVDEAGKGKHVQHKKLSQSVFKMLVSEDPNELLE